MALPYSKVNWQDGVTPENAANLGKMDQGIKDLDDAVAAILAGGTGGGIEYENVWAAGTAYESGDVVNRNGVEYLAVNPSTGQAPPAPAAPPMPVGVVPLVTALPATPFDGQEVVLTDSLTAGTYQWRLRYVAGRASNKWIFVGGPPAYSEVLASEASAGTAFVALTTPGPLIVLPAAGDYMVGLGFDAASTVATNILLMSYDIGATAAVDADATFSHPTTANGLLVSVMRRRRKNALPAVTLTAKYRQSAASSANYERRWMEVLPVAVGG